MTERDQPVCVLICLDVYLGLEKQKLVTNKQKIADAVPKNDKNPTFVVLILYWDTPNDYFRSYMMETDLPVCVLICLDVYLGLQCQQLVLNKQKSAVRIGSKHTLVDQFQSYDVRESLEMCQHNIKALRLDL